MFILYIPLFLPSVFIVHAHILSFYKFFNILKKHFNIFLLKFKQLSILKNTKLHMNKKKTLK
ncbi:LOW QUALITY PROTEIN: hypothetical protein PFMALIP_00265 [Plasmodium falciparum MaliPS096_E11]|uniref:Uncharacterized protein n=3 Tax=Plasmodium falciparum TaxID=5833 RepID=A0A024XEB4_PLAFC|nr:LOW QUALITY PROTEIN: hypothetical protein PFFVO_00252 [Plasmodium falciparum Vietnam Oak-Knoll (FVO)]ETW51685.1 LOW QUALITY PROTEIN: hypothetical protein PFMALIP_00265 [Plasmodium falciparum MaliPS096_E11]ETW63877.1 LOW QUALITY PROTEIN: hypothetical protein PFMC_00257 [Plasmodium falciparum CAMP/Malaysia]